MWNNYDKQPRIVILHIPHFFAILILTKPQILSITSISLIQLLAFDIGLIVLLVLNQYSIDHRYTNLGQGIKFLNHMDN